MAATTCSRSRPATSRPARVQIHRTAAARRQPDHRQGRIYLDKSNPDLLHDEVTTIDHALTRPWMVDRVYLRTRPPRWAKNCFESNPHLTIGTEEYFLSADNKLMPVRKDQPPPDLRYFGAQR